MATKPSNHEAFTMVPNAIIDNPNLCVRDKMALIKLKRHAYGEKITVYPSQSEIAKCLGIRRETAKAALDSLTGLSVIRPHGKGRKGRQETFTIDLDRAANLTTESACNLTTQSAAPDESVGINKTAEEYERKKTPITTSTSKIEAPDSPEAIHTVGSCPAYNGPDDSVVRFTKRELNELQVTPEGRLPDDEPDALLCNLDAVLMMAGGKLFNHKVLDTLVDEHGPRYVAFWTSWLLRKIAAEYEAGRPVKNPGGLYVEAVRGHWEVDPRWPEFESLFHTFAAETETSQRGADLAELDEEMPF